MFISSIYRITVLPYSYECATLSAAYFFKLYLQNHWGYTLLMGVHSHVQPTFVRFTYRISGLD